MIRWIAFRSCLWPVSSFATPIAPWDRPSEFGRVEPHREPYGDDAAGRRAGDQIEVAACGFRQVLLKPCEESSRKRPQNPAPVDGQEAALGRL